MVRAELKSKSTTATLAIDDGRLVQRIVGPADAYLKIIEHGFDVTIRTVPEGFSISGASAAVKHAGDALTEISKAARNKAIVLDEGYVRGLLSQHTGGPAEQIRTRKKLITARTPAQSDYIRMLREKALVFGIGPAGTGKTYLAALYAAYLLESGQVERLVLTRPAVEAGERLGFLPGDMKDKVDPYLRPLYDALYEVFTPDQVEKHIEAGIIEIAPLAFMRGRTLANAAILLDEAQNTTSMQMKMFLTRLGEGSKMFVTGDPSQLDLPPNVKSGLMEAVGLLRDDRDIGVLTFKNSDVVRRDLVGRIVTAYDRHALTLKQGG
ncbi:MAG: PhoH family protein [Proteobacteria bacterium]|nr:PhoH family protein [Pseudomonadota bacterium]